MIYFISVLGLFSLVFLFFIFLTSPANRKHQDRALLEGTFIAHRGLHNLENGIPENSLPAFLEAIKKNRPIELDIHLTKDEKVVVFHDDNVKRACGVDQNICKMTLEEIKKLRLFGTEYQIPTLEECLDLVNGKVFLLIEFKVDQNNTKKLCEKANEILSNYSGKYLIQSFYPQVLFWYRRNQKDVCRGQLSADFSIINFGKFLVGKQLMNFVGRPDFASFKYQDRSSPFFRLVVLLGAVPVGWTFRSKKELDKNRKYFHSYIYENFEM